MTILTQIVQFILIISILVVLHELGHYLTAKWFKTKVEKFYLFFNPWFSLFKKKIGETEYGIGWLPMGGYVKIAGMIDESMDTEQMEKEPQPWEFRSKPAWQRLIIMLGGIIVNVLLAWFIYSALLIKDGDTYIPMENLEHGIYVNENGEALGFKTGDKIVSIDGDTATRFDDLMLNVILGEEVVVERNGANKTIPITDEALKSVFSGLKNVFFFPRFEALIDSVPSNSGAHKGGLQKGDKIVAIDGKSLQFTDELKAYLDNVDNDTVTVAVNRGGSIVDKKVALTDKRLGVVLSVDPDKFIKTDDYGFFAAIPAGLAKTYDVLVKQVKQLKVIFKPKTEAYKQVKGPIGIVEMMPPTWDWTFFWRFTAMFSIWLAFVNILPIPALDGGHAMFLTYEIISGRPPSQKVLEKGQIIGFVIIMGIMLLVFGNDIWNIVKRFI
ncbi:RIP metalloprotease RseP [Hyunsoonleella sp. SJ7]|uniref:Zinc metalloprotease n=1 Tax=Hyunsoonleella aquatilis TaxID=2762758 RepID=A0A923H801_9FLAO|nr:RIP metalloprotease RseP [Hyunsoonleella aquatilis]MBC3756814.1 RIP metalloprotease RseP [Hyunsoonleella aquatilis]